jgi:hypothetical protein
MNSIKTDPRGTMNRHGKVWSINNALIEKVSLNCGNNGYIIVSYAERHPNNMTVIEQLRLNITGDTVIVNQAGRPVCMCDLRPGMWVDAEFSSAMTRSIPPHANAYRLVVSQNSRPPQPGPNPPRPPQPGPGPNPGDRSTTTARVVSVDTANNMITTGNPININRQQIFTVSRQTQILDRRGRSIPLRAILPGQRVRVTHANFQTMSIPPQSPAYVIQVV